MNIRYFLQLKKGIKKGLFFIRNFSRYFLPDSLYRHKLSKMLSNTSVIDKEAVEERIAYYNRLPERREYDLSQWIAVADFQYPFRKKERFSTYFFDLHRYTRYFNPRYRFAYLFGDVTKETEVPAFVKSRPIADGNSNSVLLKLNQVRHFVFVKDRKSFRDKKNMIVSRNVVRQPHRKRFLELYCQHPMCDIGQINRDTDNGHPEWVKEYLTIPQQLEYKFVCCIEGNDVATNLKWVMASNSLAVMPRPAYETWFMEGRLIANYHYVEIKADYSDLIEKMEYYIHHPEEAERIIGHAHEYIRQFTNARQEAVISLAVMQKYFYQTKQTSRNVWHTV